MLGLLDLLPLGTAPDSQGYSQLPLGLWRRQTPEGLSLLSFDQAILASTLPQMAIERSAITRRRPASASATYLRRRSAPGSTR